MKSVIDTMALTLYLFACIALCWPTYLGAWLFPFDHHMCRESAVLQSIVDMMQCFWWAALFIGVIVLPIVLF